MKTNKTAVVVAWRAGEDDLNATVQAAGKSAGSGSIVIPVEDKAGEGPARTRHRGIMAAAERGIETVCIIDAHMRFKGAVIKRMADKVQEDGGGLLCPKCFHNPTCSFDDTHPSGAKYYAGAEIAYRARFPNGEQNALCWKWSSDSTPGPRGCIGGACYVFPVAWYLKVGSPLAALPGWGCDEEALSISAWLSGVQPHVFDGAVAHRWREKAPWKKTAKDDFPIWSSRVSLIDAVVSDFRDKAELIQWQLEKIPPPMRKYAVISKEAEAWRKALSKLPLSWFEWRVAVARPDVIEGPVTPAARRPQPALPRRTILPRANYGAYENRRTCSHCGSARSEINRTVPDRVTGRRVIRYRVCTECGRPRTTTELLPTTQEALESVKREKVSTV